jgi:hypothetical protein
MSKKKNIFFKIKKIIKLKINKYLFNSKFIFFIFNLNFKIFFFNFFNFFLICIYFTLMINILKDKSNNLDYS